MNVASYLIKLLAPFCCRYGVEQSLISFYVVAIFMNYIWFFFFSYEYD